MADCVDKVGKGRFQPDEDTACWAWGAAMALLIDRSSDGRDFINTIGT
jgi:hypothetical protein